jgi:hypothetical protein
MAVAFVFNDRVNLFLSIVLENNLVRVHVLDEHCPYPIEEVDKRAVDLEDLEALIDLDLCLSNVD